MKFLEAILEERYLSWMSHIGVFDQLIVSWGLGRVSFGRQYVLLEEFLKAQ